MMHIQKLIEQFAQMYAEHWLYAWGAAEEGVVDCSGAFVYAYKRLLQRSIAHGSNTLFRDRKFCGASTKVPKPGYVAFKKREWASDQSNNKWYGCDPGDIYHVGLVDETGKAVYNAKGTKYGFCKDTLAGWDCFAPLKDFDYEEDTVMTETIEPPFVGKVSITSGYLNLREKAGVTSKIIGKLENGDVLDILERTGNWYKVGFEGLTGYVLGKYVTAVSAPTAESGDISACTTLTNGETEITLMGHWTVKSAND